jgi:cytochrome c biogenesis protein CcmG, thiol:disulfide interchange protein DsbE
VWAWVFSSAPHYTYRNLIAQGAVCEYNSGVTRLKWYLLIAVVAIAGSGWIYWTRVPDDAEVIARVAAHVNFRAPAFTLTTLDGKLVSSNDFHGKIVLVNFWATWCPPCRSEMPEIEAAYQAHRNNFVVLGINQAESSNAAKQFADEFHLTFPILLDSNGSVGQLFQVQALPTSFFIDPKGIIRAANLGQMNRAYIETQIAALETTH